MCGATRRFVRSAGFKAGALMAVNRSRPAGFESATTRTLRRNLPHDTHHSQRHFGAAFLLIGAGLQPTQLKPDA